MQSVDQKHWAYWAIFAIYKITSKLKKTENNSLLREKNTEEIVLNHKGTRIVNDEED